MDITQPRKLSEEIIKLAYEHARLGERLVEIKKTKAKEWQTIRSKHKSDAQADREWDSTPLGIEEMEIKMSMQSKKMRVSALKTHIQVLNTEAYNQY